MNTKLIIVITTCGVPIIAKYLLANSLVELGISSSIFIISAIVKTAYTK